MNAMTTSEIIKEIENMRKYNYTLAPDEVFDTAIESIIIAETEDVIDFNLIGEMVDSHGNVHYEDLKRLRRKNERK